ncbi:MAG: type II toxin-antitoxin system Phd/YefM family antitoxin [SAR324 cluster bacterium]|nr:type II toxin-antitoxin system Phd/YefM family antitoxin [SAR324 cluster bacterium]
MISVTFTEFRKNASALISNVEQGEVIQILRHGKPIAEISPIPGQANTPAWKKQGLKLVSKGDGLSKAILQEREVS